MAKEKDCRLDTACKCLDLPRPSRDDWLRMSDEETRNLSALMGSLSDPIRLRIMEMLSKGPLYVCLIQHLLNGIKYSKLSYHLDILKKEGLIGSKREGNFLRYFLTPRGKVVAMKVMKLGLG